MSEIALNSNPLAKSEASLDVISRHKCISFALFEREQQRKSLVPSSLVQIFHGLPIFRLNPLESVLMRLSWFRQTLGGLQDRHRDQFGHLPKVLGGGCEDELITRTVWTSKSQAIELENTLEVSE